MKKTKCRVIQTSKKEKLWHAYKTFYKVVAKFDQTKDAAEVAKEKPRPVPVGMLDMIF